MALLEVKNLTRHFGGLTAVNDVTFSLDKGEIVGIIGPNGAGKSTFIHLVSGIRMPSSGEIYFEGEDVTYMQPHHRARLGIGRTYQTIHPLESLTLIENIMVSGLFAQGMSQKEARKDAEGLAELLELKDLDRHVSKLTILDIKKMEIAHALAGKPKVLFLDEVMAGLNADETHALIKIIKGIVSERNIAIGVVEHVMGVIKELTHSVIVLDTGRLIAQGPYEEVSKNPEVISAYLGGSAS